MELQQHDVKKENILDFSVICRACLSVTPSTLSVKSKDLKYDVPLATMINQISAFERHEHSDFPDKLCFVCAEQLRIAYGFQQMCDDSYRILLNHSVKAQKNDTATDAKEDDVGCEDTVIAEQPDMIDKQEMDLNDLWNEVDYLEEYLIEDGEPMVTAPSNTAAEIKQEDSCAEEELEPITVPGEDGILEIKQQCHICGQILSKISHLSRHMKAHAGAKPYNCKQCSKSFSRSDNLRIHIKNHSLERDYKCSQCDQCFKRVDAAKAHMTTKHREFVEANYHVCTICDNFFKTEAKLNGHMVTHKSENQLVCELCGKHFVGLLAYETHVRRHTSSAEQLVSYDCTHCEKKFSSKGHLAMHMRYYTGVKALTCKYCDKQCRRRGVKKFFDDANSWPKPKVVLVKEA
uniref:Protein krueppel n=1 Tax=Anopheles christyi TaxID=43041 RepID=A0A182K3E0_9DIPT